MKRLEIILEGCQFKKVFNSSLLYDNKRTVFCNLKFSQANQFFFFFFLKTELSFISVGISVVLLTFQDMCS